MKVKYLQYTSTGDRGYNQDYQVLRVTDDWSLFIVADGMGGHQGGEKASRFFCEGMLATVGQFVAELSVTPKETMQSWIDAAITHLTEAIKADPAAAQARTTCAILWLNEQLVLTAHLGDSRIYRLNAEQILWRTRDHSVTQMLLDEGDISEQEMGTHPDQNRLFRSINISGKHQAVIKAYPPAKTGETFLLCSDGFWSYTSQDELLKLANPEVTEQQLQNQVNTVIERAQGDSDNVTVQWVHIE